MESAKTFNRDEELENFQLFITNAIKADLRNISKSPSTTLFNHSTTNQSSSPTLAFLNQQQQQAIRFLSILQQPTSELSLEDKIEKVIKPCLKLICGFIHNLSSKEKISKEVIFNRMLSNCKFSIYILFEIFMYPNRKTILHSNNVDETMDDESDEDQDPLSINSEIASYFGLYDELVCFMIMFSFEENFLESLTCINPQRFSNIKVEHSEELMKQFLNRIFNWVCVTSVEEHIQNQLSALGYEIVFKHLIHSIQNVLFKSIHNRFHSSMNISKYWFRKLWKHDASAMKPHLIELLKRLFGVMKVKRANSFHSTFNIFMNELIQSLSIVKSSQVDDDINDDDTLNDSRELHQQQEDFGKFILQSLKEIITNTTEEIEAKNQAIIMYYNLLIDDIDNVEDPSIVKSFIELMFDKVLFTDKNADCRITALEMIQKVTESKFYKLRNSSRINQQTNISSVIVPINRIFSQISHILKFDPNQGVRNAAFDLWLMIFDLMTQRDEENKDNNLLILSNMLHIKSRDKEKRIRCKVFEKITEMGIFRFNQSLIEQLQNQEEYSEPIISNKSLKLSRIVRSKKATNGSLLVCPVLREILIIGMLDEEKKVRDLTEQLFVDLILTEMNPLELMKELEESYYEIVRTTVIGEDPRSQKPSCWGLFEGVLKGNINNLYAKQLQP